MRKDLSLFYNSKSDSAKIAYKGMHFGKSEYPNYLQTFKESIEELDKHTTAKLRCKDSIGSPSDSTIQVEVKIKKILWDFGFSAARMESKLIYKLPDSSFTIMGRNKVYMQGTKKGNLFKSLEDGHYNFLSLYCNK